MKRPPPPPPPKKRAKTQRPVHDETARDEVPAADGLPKPRAAPVPVSVSGPSAVPVDIDIVVDDSGPTALAPPQPLPILRIAICETHGYLASARTAVAACGHTVALGAGGADGSDEVTALIRRENVDAILVALPGPGTPFDASPVVAAALALAPRRPIIVGIVTGTAGDGVRRAHAAGADLVAVRPHDAERLAPILLAAARLGAAREAEANARGAETVLRGKLEQVAHGEPGGLQPLELFQRALETEIKRARRYDYSLAVAMFAVELEPPPPPSGVRGILRARAGNAIVRSIRDIDVATQLDHERFMVLLPYTTIAGAATLARRVIDAVSAGDAVTAGGRVFPPRVTGAVAGAQPGEQLSFSKLVREASRALEQARREGREIGGSSP
ncbi:MAG TPA: diguanylate cyclase [Kofleriaceae bacterium]